MARQMAKTNGVCFNVIGHRLDDDPVPIVYVGPTQSNIDDVIEPKVQEMLENSDSLWEKTGRGQENKKHVKRVSGVALRFGWAGSATQLKADAAGIAFVDEVDGIEAEAKAHGEGTTVDMAEAVTSTYPEGKLGITSTPTEGHVESAIDDRTGFEHWLVSENVVSAVWKYWQEGSRHEWAVPCPSCLEYFVPRFKYLKWPKGSTAEEAEREAALACPHCNHSIKDASRTWMNERGCMVAPGQKPLQYDPDNGSVTDGGPGFILIDYDDEQKEKRITWGDFLLPSWSRSHASFWVSGLCTFSTKKTYGFIAAKFIDAHNSGEHERLQAVYNTDLGELYRVSGDAPEWQSVLACATEYIMGYVHPDITTITSGVDVQKNRLVFVVRGWAPGFTSYLIMRGELWGETDQDDVWEELDSLLGEKFDGLPVSKMVVDSGYRKNEVYTFCREHRPVAVPSRGRDTMDKPYSASLVDVNYRGRVIKGGMQLWHYDSDVMKSWVHARIDWDKTKTGAWFLPSDIDEDYCKQIIAEQRVVKPSGQITWIKVAKDNHFLDAEALAYLAARIIGIKKQAVREGKKPKEKPKPAHQDTGGFGSEDWSGRL